MATNYILSGTLASLGGLLSVLQIGSVTAYMGVGLEFNAVAVVVVGGISLFGGRGKVFQGVTLGALVFEMIRNGLNHLGANPYAYRLVGGAVIFVAHVRRRIEALCGSQTEAINARTVEPSSSS